MERSGAILLASRAERIAEEHQCKRHRKGRIRSRHCQRRHRLLARDYRLQQRKGSDQKVNKVRHGYRSTGIPAFTSSVLRTELCEAKIGVCSPRHNVLDTVVARIFLTLAVGEKFHDGGGCFLN